MQKDLTGLIVAERRKNEHLIRCLANNSEKLKGQEWAVEQLRKENGSKAVENEKLKRQNIEKMDTLNQETNVLRRENEELKKKNEETKEALTRATVFLFQYKEDLAKVKAEAETFRKCREANEPTTTVLFDLQQREITRLHAEKERERKFNDAVKQLRALTAVRLFFFFFSFFFPLGDELTF
jgi:seryl-tRNA synthetase